MDFTGRPTKGYVFVEADGCRTDKEVRRWVKQGAEFVETLGSSTRRLQRKTRTR